MRYELIIFKSKCENFNLIYSLILIEYIQETRLHTFLLHKIVEPAENKDFQSLLASFRASGGMLKKKITSNKNNDLLNAF